MRLEETDSRRLTGPNLFWDQPGAVMDVAIEGAAIHSVVARWNRKVRTLLDGVGWRQEETRQRIFTGGASLVISAPIDALYAACEINEAAWNMVVAELTDAEAPAVDAEVLRLSGLIREERNSALLALRDAALAKQVPFLWDDDEISLGYGPSAQVWPMQSLPNPATLDWSRYQSIPLALVTGTNGKSTSVRMADVVFKAAGVCTGITSTDYIRVGDEVLDTGDYSGPGGARTLLRNPRVETAILEVARGGLLRRGLGVERADAALITNVAADHLGDYGINTVPELIEAKFIVRRGLSPDAPLILNADDEGVVAFAAQLKQEKAWFSLDPENLLIAEHCKTGGHAVVCDQGQLLRCQAGERHPIVMAADIPATLGGAAQHNVQNAMAVIALCHALGVNDQAIADGLKQFRGDKGDNPGRGNLFEHNGVKILVDFAHNEHGMLALANTVKQIPAEQRFLLMGQAGDRLDKDICDLARAACSQRPDRLLLADLPGYERGRAVGEVPQLIKKEVMAHGQPEDSITLFDSPIAAVSELLENAKEGDLLVLLALTQRQEVMDMIQDFINKPDTVDA